MKIATWNVNSVKARLPNVISWLRQAEPDVVLLQEIKGETETFPALEFEALGYQAAVHGQKSYNGVAILSRLPMTDVLRGLPGNEDDPQARYIEVTIKNCRIASLYLPNGNPVFDDSAARSEKYNYKLRWMECLRQHAGKLLVGEMPVILGGDYNVIPEAVDCYDATAWEKDALFYPPTRAAWRSLWAQGYTEAFRALRPHQEHAYTFWDYQAGAWHRDAGIRIDHFLLSPEAADRLQSCVIDREPRGLEKASDHTPVMIDIID